jgi:hypothetical protein
MGSPVDILVNDQRRRNAMIRLRLLIAIPVVAALPLLGATAASAAPAHVQAVSGAVAANTMAIRAQVSPDTDGCESGYGIWQDDEGYYLGKPGVKAGQALETTTDNNYCWLFPVNDSVGYIENEAGYCAGYNGKTKVVDLQDCVTNATYQEWYLNNDHGTITLYNEWAHTHPVGNEIEWMSGYGDDADVNLGETYPFLAWHTCAPPGPC